MARIMAGPWLTACIHIAAKRSFADIIEAAGSHQASIEHISQEAKVHPIWTRAILQALATADIFVETEQHLFKNTLLSDCLRRDHPQTLKWQASVLLGSRPFVLLSQLDYYINQVGTSFHQELWGQELYELLEKQDEDQSSRLSPERVVIELGSRAEFDLMLESIAVTIDTAIAQAYQFKGTVCDLGGGRGRLLTTIASHHPDVKGILFESQVVVDNLQSKQAEYPFSLVVGDFFQQVTRADIYILHQIFHNWPDNLCSEILQKCAEANPHAKVLVIERLIGDSQGSAEIMNLIMMMEQNGKERTIEEYRAIGKNAGFNQSQVYSNKAGYAIVELTIDAL
jgi:hypothetical protein